MIPAVNEDGVEGILEIWAIDQGLEIAGTAKHSMVNKDGFGLSSDVFDAVEGHREGNFEQIEHPG